jgi:hypothetical protein
MNHLITFDNSTFVILYLIPKKRIRETPCLLDLVSKSLVLSRPSLLCLLQFILHYRDEHESVIFVYPVYNLIHWQFIKRKREKSTLKEQMKIDSCCQVLLTLETPSYHLLEIVTWYSFVCFWLLLSLLLITLDRDWTSEVGSKSFTDRITSQRILLLLSLQSALPLVLHLY